MYALDAHDRHVMRVESDLRLVCVFDPALAGGEVHDEWALSPRRRLS